MAIRTGKSLGRVTARWLVTLGIATSLSGCMASALDLQSTFAPTPSANLGLAPADGTTAPSSEYASDQTDATQSAVAGAQPEDGAVMALAGDDTEGTPAETDMPVQQAMMEQSGAIIQDAEGMQGETAELVTLGESTDKTARPADPATARIYSASGAPTASAPAPVIAAAPEKNNRGLLSLFSNNRSNNARKALVPPQPVKQQPAVAELWSATDNAAATAKQPPARPLVAVASASGPAAELPGVDRERALGFNQSSEPQAGIDDPEDRPIQLASAAGLARLAPNGLTVQHDEVDISCLKPALVRVLKQVERHYGRNVIVTSGYRSPSRNKKARGAQHSLHMYCSAADIQIEGVSKVELASYLRSMQGRGGVGTYCYTNSVHIDIGPERDWNWRCRRRK